MTQKMTILPVLFMLVLALQSPKVLQAKETSEGEQAALAICEMLCKDKAEKGPHCVEMCGLGQRANAAFLEGFTCHSKCPELKEPPSIKACEDGCQKKYEAGLAEIVKACHTICGMGETDPSHIETCKKSCTSPAVADTSKR